MLDGINRTGRIAIYIVGAFAALLLLQLWGNVFSEEGFGKLLFTLIIGAVVLTLYVVIRRDMGEEEKQKKDRYLD